MDSGLGRAFPIPYFPLSFSPLPSLFPCFPLSSPFSLFALSLLDCLGLRLRLVVLKSLEEWAFVPLGFLALFYAACVAFLLLRGFLLVVFVVVLALASLDARRVHCLRKPASYSSGCWPL